MNSRIGIVTVTYNSRHFLPGFLRSLDAQDHGEWHCWIIDNASRDGTVEALAALGLDAGRYTVVANPANVGVAAGNNQGIIAAVAAGCDWVLLLNNDTEFPPRLLTNLLDSAVQRAWDAVVPKIHFGEPSDAIWYAGGGFDARKGYTGFHRGIGEKDAGQYDVAAPVDYSPTCCMLVRRSVFESVGLMDEAYFAYFDDTDFCWRLREGGGTLGYAPETALTHKVGGSTGGTASPFFALMTARNRLYFLRRHFGRLAPYRWLPVFAPYYVWRYLVKSWNPAAFAACIKGTLAFPRMRASVPPLRRARHP